MKSFGHCGNAGDKEKCKLKHIHNACETCNHFEDSTDKTGNWRIIEKEFNGQIYRCWSVPNN